jgi:hypothetical protein
VGSVTIDTCRRGAWHEAGHAIVAHALGWDVRGIEAIGIINFETESHARNGVRTIRDMGERIAGLFGGYIAERRRFKRRRSTALVGAAGDFVSIEMFNPSWLLPQGDPRRLRQIRLAEAAVNDAGWRLFARAWYRVAHAIIRRDWTHLIALAAVLEQKFKNRKARHLSCPRLRKLLLPVALFQLPEVWPHGPR